MAVMCVNRAFYLKYRDLVYNDITFEIEISLDRYGWERPIHIDKLNEITARIEHMRNLQITLYVVPNPNEDCFGDKHGTSIPELEPEDSGR